MVFAKVSFSGSFSHVDQNPHSSPGVVGKEHCFVKMLFRWGKMQISSASSKVVDPLYLVNDAKTPRRSRAVARTTTTTNNTNY